MYLSTTDAGRNIFHEMFCIEVTMKNIQILESELGQKLIRKLLLSRCVQGSFLPIHYAIEKSPMPVTKWIISRFDDDAIQQFNMLARRTKYHSILVSQTIKDKAIKTYIGNTITKCLRKIAFKQVDIMIIKDIFNCTIDWQCVELQKLILEKVSPEQHAYLFNKDDQLYNWGHVLHQVMRSDQKDMGKVLLSAITDDKQLMVRDIYGLYIIPRGMLQGSTKVMKLILERLKHDPSLIIEQVNGCDSGGYRGFYYAWSYKRTECAMKVVKYLKDEQLHVALNEAAKHDKDLSIIPNLLSCASSDKARKLLRQYNDKGESILTVAINHNRRQLIVWIMNELKDNDSIFITPDWEHHCTPIHCLAKKDDEYSDLLETMLNKLAPKQRFAQLFQKILIENQ